MLLIVDSGMPTRPIVITKYGTGERPKIKYADPTNSSRAVKFVGSWLVLDGIVMDSSGASGVKLDGDHNVVQNCEIANAGIGVEVRGKYNLVTHCFIHKLHMVLNTVGGNGDDYGAVGVHFFNKCNEASYNILDSCFAPSLDFGTDGGAFEIFGNGDSCYVHHNWTHQTNGFMEVSAPNRESVADVRIAYNVIICDMQSQILLSLHNASAHFADIRRFRFENNSVIWRSPSYVNYGVTGFAAEPTDSTLLIFRNNIVYSHNYRDIVTGQRFTHSNNLYFKDDGSANVGQPLGLGDVVANPKFINLGSLNLHLLPNSPAIGAGTSLGYSLDFDSIPVGARPAAGAFEYILPPDGYFQVTPDSLTSPGTVSLSWNVSGVQTIMINNGIGSLPPSGSLAVIVKKSTTFDLTADNAIGSFHRTVSVAVSTVSPVDGDDHPFQLTLEQNYPNPFNPTTTIRFGLPVAANVSLTIFNPLGQEVAQLVNGQLDAGYHSVEFSAEGLASGVYFYRIRTGDSFQTRNLVLLR
jgi:hypothetical protein